MKKMYFLNYVQLLPWFFIGNGDRDEVSLEDIEIEDDTDALNELLNS